MKRNTLFLLGLIGWSLVARALADDQAPTLCFLSLNNSREFELTRDFFAGAKRSSGETVRVLEFHDPAREADPRASFVALVESGAVCDGLVISGHHTGSFGGRRARGSLHVSDLEALSCDTRYRDFFRQVRGVWLQGCRTLGVGPVDLDGEGGRELQADYHMQRVGAELLHDGLEQSFAELSLDFSATLDQDNPLATRYMRTFPSASVFGWTKSSPGENARSEMSLLYHMSHMAHLSGGGDLVNPLRAIPPDVQAGMSRSMSGLLAGDESAGALAREAWLSHGRVTRPGLGFYNPDLNTYAPLARSADDSLATAKALACDLRNAGDLDAVQAGLDQILSRDEYVAYNLNLLREVFRQYGSADPQFYRAMRERLLASDALMSLLASKLKSPRTGLLMKIEYYSFYRELTGQANPAVEALIRDHVRYFLLADDLAGSQYDIRDFRESLLLSLARHQLAGADFYRQVIRAPAVGDATLYAIAWSFLQASPPEAEALVSDIVNSPAVSGDTLRVVAIWINQHGIGERRDILSAIVRQPRVNEETLATVSAVIARYNPSGSEQLLRQIVTHPRADSAALGSASFALSKYDRDIDRDLLADILLHPSLDQRGLQNMARVMGSNRQPGNTDLLWQIIHHPQVDAIVLSSLAIALGDDRFTGEPALIEAIRSHPMADERTLKYADRAARKAR